MATTAQDSSRNTYLDIILSQNPDGSAARIVKTLDKLSPLMQVAAWQEANGTDNHTVSFETKLPTVDYPAIGEGVEASKHANGQFKEPIGMLQGRSVIPTTLLDMATNKAAFVTQKNEAFMRAMKNQIESDFFYGSNASNPRKFNGIMTRYASTTGVYGSQIVKFGGSGSDNTSLVLVVFGPGCTTMVYPKGSPAGLRVKDKGAQMLTDDAGNRYEALETLYDWYAGLAVEDAESVVRVCNIDVSDLSAASTAVPAAMLTAMSRVRDISAGRAVWFGNRTAREFLDKQLIYATASSTLTQENYTQRQPLPTFRGVTFVTTDAITNAEATVS